MIIPLQQSYNCRYGTPTIDRVDSRVFLLSWHGSCMNCNFCHDLCCQYGTTVDAIEAARIHSRADALETYLGIPRTDWFHDAYVADADYPAGATTRTTIRRGLCVFVNPQGRGCLLHRFALETGIDVHDIKPMTCTLFPVYWACGQLFPNEELLDGSLICLGPGQTVYRSARAELEYYFGPHMVEELDRLETETLTAPAAGASGSGRIGLGQVAASNCRLA